VPEGYDPRTQAVGVGYTPEGLDQNPAYFELLQEAAFKVAPEPNVTEWLVTRAHRRYGLLGGGGGGSDPRVTAAWAALAASGYAIDKGVGDSTGVGQMDVLDRLLPHAGRGAPVDINKPGSFQGCTPADRFEGCAPSTALCLEWGSWGSLNDAAPAVAAAAAKAGMTPLPETFRYDVVNTAREVLAQLSTPLLLNFTASFNGSLTPAAEPAIRESGARFVELLADLDSLLATDTAFMLGPWLASARSLGERGVSAMYAARFD
jgi:alpha-N-acetylglucosaminidase